MRAAVNLPFWRARAAAAPRVTLMSTYGGAFLVIAPIDNMALDDKRAHAAMLAIFKKWSRTVDERKKR